MTIDRQDTAPSQPPRHRSTEPTFVVGDLGGGFDEPSPVYDKDMMAQRAIAELRQANTPRVIAVLRRLFGRTDRYN